MPSPGYRVSGKEVEVRGSGSQHHQRCGCCNLQLIQSHVAPSHGSPARVLSPLFFLVLLSCCLSHVAKRSTPKPHGPPYSLLQNLVVLFLSFRTAWSSFLSLSEPCGPLFTSSELPDPLLSPPKPCGSLPIYLLQNLVVLFLGLPCLGLNPSAHLPLQPHFRLLLQSVTPASIPIFFQLYWAAIVSLGRCGPMAWSQSSPRSHAGPVTWGSYFPVPSWVEFAPIPLAQSMATAI